MAKVLDDHIAENSVDEVYKPLKSYFPDEGVSFEAKIFLRHTLVGEYSLIE